jgi:hypothetical protein
MYEKMGVDKSLSAQVQAFSRSLSIAGVVVSPEGAQRHG